MASSISKAQAEALADNFLRGIGESKGKFADIGSLPITEQELIKVAAAFIFEVQKNIQKDKTGRSRVSTGAMFDGIGSGQVQRTTDGYTMTMGYIPGQPEALYYDFVNKGVSGVVRGIPKSPYKFKTPYPSKKMAMEIRKWVELNRREIDAKKPANLAKSKGGVSGGTLASARAAQAKRKKLSEVEITNSLAYAIATNIKKFGLQRSGFFDDAVKAIFNKDFYEAMAAAAAADVTLKLRKSI